MPQTAAEKRAARAAAKQSAEAAGAPIPPTEAEKLNMAQITNPLAVPIASGEKATLQQSGSKVWVGCKLGITSYAIQLSRLEDQFEQNMQGGRMVKAPNKYGPVVVLRGTAYPRGTPPKGFPERPYEVAGAALTIVDKDFWNTWSELNKLNPVVTNKMVFAADSLEGFAAMARELAGLASGIDPINPDNDFRMPKSSRKGEVLELEAGQK